MSNNMKRTIQVRMSEKDIEMLRKKAKDRGLSLSAFLRWYIKGLLDK